MHLGWEYAGAACSATGGRAGVSGFGRTVNPYYLRGDWVCYEKERLRLLRNEQGEKRAARSASAEQEVRASEFGPVISSYSETAGNRAWRSKCPFIPGQHFNSMTCSA